MQSEIVLGLPVTAAQAILSSYGITDVTIEVSTPPRDQAKEGTLRVIALRDGGRVLIVSPFQDAPL